VQRAFRWHWLFPATRGYRDRQSRLWVRHHLHETVVQRAVAAAVRRARLGAIGKEVSCHTFRHSFAAHLLEMGYDIRIVQELLGHKDVTTTMVYSQLVGKPAESVRSPADLLALPVGPGGGRGTGGGTGGGHQLGEGAGGVATGPLESQGVRLTESASLMQHRLIEGRLVKRPWRKRST
jgi:hypothetical protein